MLGQWQYVYLSLFQKEKAKLEVANYRRFVESHFQIQDCSVNSINSRCRYRRLQLSCSHISGQTGLDLCSYVHRVFCQSTECTVGTLGAGSELVIVLMVVKTPQQKRERDEAFQDSFGTMHREVGLIQSVLTKELAYTYASVLPGRS